MNKLMTPEIKNLGQINDITLPEGWVGGEPYRFTSSVGSRSFRAIHPADQPGICLGFYYRGLPVSNESANNFNSLLAKSSHVLTAAEVLSVSEILRDKSSRQDFTIMVARTEDINGKRVLVVEGRYKEINEDAFAIFIDASGDGKAVQEVYYQAPKATYLIYLKAARDAIRLIKWK